MKTSENNLDDLIFENRNKAYGAYANRKNYKKYMFWALFSGIVFFLTIISVPLIANYINGVNTNLDGPVVITDTLVKVTIEPKFIPPALPQPKVPVKVFRTPIITSKDEEITDLSELIETGTNRAIGDTGGGVIIDEGVPETPPIIEAEKPETFIIVEEMPEFPGGEEGRLRFLSENVKYPVQAREIGIQGTVYVRFVVDQTGKVVETELLRGIGGGCDEEAVRVINAMPHWKPGRQRGQVVRVMFSTGIAFKLAD